MIKRISIFAVIAAGGMIASASAGPGPFKVLKKRMANAACCRFTFLSILDSEIFDEIDTTQGTALIANDGRYSIGTDSYIDDGQYLYSYSQPNNQVTVEKVDPYLTPREEVSFITRLDDFFDTHPLSDDSLFLLLLRDSSYTNLPDSMTVHLVISNGKAKLASVEYRDINEDLNRIIFVNQEYLSACDEDAFRADFADSVEVIKLY
jgi:hypothetical protein